MSMALRYPTRMLHRITDITPEFLSTLGITALLLDVDNTLSEHDSQSPYPGSLEWVSSMRKNGIQMIILSNNTRERVEPFAAQYGLPFLTYAMKPLPVGYLRAVHQLGVSHRNCAAVGDQIFTDIVGANLCGIKSILLEPILEETSRSFRIRRKLERSIRGKMAVKEAEWATRKENSRE